MLGRRKKRKVEIYQSPEIKISASLPTQNFVQTTQSNQEKKFPLNHESHEGLEHWKEDVGLPFNIISANTTAKESTLSLLSISSIPSFSEDEISSNTKDDDNIFTSFPPQLNEVTVGTSFFSSEIDMEEAAEDEDYKIHSPQISANRLKIKSSRREKILHPAHLRGMTQIILQCCPIGDELEKISIVNVLLRDQWIDCEYQEGNEISILSYKVGLVSPLYFNTCEITIDKSCEYLLILNPQCPISVTTIADSVSCLRKGVLSSKFQSSVVFNPPSIQLVSGSVTHQVFESSIKYFSKCGHLDSEVIIPFIKEAIGSNLLTIYSSGESEETVNEAVQNLLREFPPWCRRYITPHPSSQAKVLDELKNTPITYSPEIALPKVISLEESIQSRLLGLKGKIDSVVLTRMATSKESTEYLNLMIPLELKTGKSTISTAHRAQTLLYCLLLSEKYGLAVPFGLLFYISSQNLLRIVATIEEIRALVMIRNRLASEIALYSQNRHLPPPITNAHLCGQCAQKENCATLARLQDIEDAGSISMNKALMDFQQKYPSELTSSKNSKESSDFFRKWEEFVSLEEKESYAALEKAPHISCKLVHSRENSNSTFSAFGRYSALFKICEDTRNDFFIVVGDPVGIRRSSNTYEAAIGYVVERGKDSVTIVCDRDVGRDLAPKNPRFDPIKNHSMETIDHSGELFTLFKDELFSAFLLGRLNLVRLYSPAFRKSLYPLIVQMTPPSFEENIILPSDIVDKFTSGLDTGQFGAIRHCLCAKEYGLILGMPGTGKTTTLVALISILVKCGFNVLVTAYTHSAVDNVLLKLQQEPAFSGRILRHGSVDRVDPRLHPFLIHQSNFPTTNSLRIALKSKEDGKGLVVGASCLAAANNPILSTVNFDYCIVDEASQISVPVILGPLMMATKFIMVGDHYQLPPLVKSSRAIQAEMNKSMFEILAKEHPFSIYTLRKQYRMCAEIQLIANRTVYEGKLECGSDEVRFRKLKIKDEIREDISLLWMKVILDPLKRVLFVNYDSVFPSSEIPVGNSFSNPSEAKLITGMVEELIRHLVPPNEICIISPYRPQIQCILDLLRGRSEMEMVEVSTVDRYQGRDKECVLFSLVRSNSEHNIGLLLHDWHRLNVAFTRAKCKLILVGSWLTVMTQPILSPLSTLITEQGWLLDI